MPNRFYFKKDILNGVMSISLGYHNPDNPAKDLLAKITPEDGNNLIQYKVGEYDIIHYNKNFKPAYFFTGNPILYPLPNRVENCHYKFNGKKYWQTKKGMPVFLHSLVFDEKWQYYEPRIEESSIILETYLEINKNHQVYEGFPFCHRITIKYILTDTRLKIAYCVKNKDNKEMGYGICFHTYFNKISGDENTLICVPANYIMELTDDLLPTGKSLAVEGEKYNLKNPVSVGDLDLDFAYTDLEKNKDVYIDYSNIKLRLWLRSTDDFTHVQVYTPKGRPFFCIEKETCSTDAHNLHAKGFKKEAHLITVSPGEQYEGMVEYVPEYY